ncbi:MAG: DNA primase [Candidatus Peribacteraceae bacterium]|nr:DNA primase [Candidatus Peribacteraceae bacterium]
MDSVAEIKMRLPIEQLVAQYAQLTKKGRNFVCLCPFHNDSHPSFLVSPDKGIAYCFACRSGGDIFSFYQKIEGCDFPQAIKELAEKTGVKLETRGPSTAPKKDEKDRARECAHAALQLYRSQLKNSPVAREYLLKRQVTPEQIEQFEIGVAPDSFSATYEHLLKNGFSRKEILAAGLGIQKELQEERIYDRFRNRLMFPIHDAQGNLAGFGGRTLGDDDAKYINSSDGILFHKSGILFGMHHAKDSIRAKGKVLLVEGYFDVLACHKVGATHAVATCGTALTPEHVKLLKRYAETATLCLDSDRAGQEAMERAFMLLSKEGVHVEAVILPGKDPSETLASDPALLGRLLESSAAPYLDTVLEAFRKDDLSAPLARRTALRRLLMLLGGLSSDVERRDYLAKASGVFQTTETALQEDLSRASQEIPLRTPSLSTSTAVDSRDLFSTIEITLGLFLCYPQLRHLLPELIAPEEGMAKSLFVALSELPPEKEATLENLSLPQELKERAAVLALYCEQHQFHDWSEVMAAREIRKHCKSANKEMLHLKQEEITRRLLDARRDGKAAEEVQLQNQYQQVLRLMKMAS